MGSTTHVKLISVVVPLCNEEDSIDQLNEKLNRLQKAFEGEARLEFVLVDDGSTDRTVNVCKQHSETGKIATSFRTPETVGSERPSGRGFIIRKGRSFVRSTPIAAMSRKGLSVWWSLWKRPARMWRWLPPTNPRAMWRVYRTADRDQQSLFSPL